MYDLKALGQSPAGLLVKWHENRIALLLLTLLALIGVHIVRTLRSQRRRIGVSPPRSPPTEKKTVELRPEWLPESTVLNPDAWDLDSHAQEITEPPALALKRRISPRRIKGAKSRRKALPGVQTAPATDPEKAKIQVLVLFQSLSGTTERYATHCAKALAEWAADCESVPSFLPPQLHDLSYIEFDDYFISPPTNSASTRYFYLVLLPSYDIDTTLSNFLENLQETHNDFRIDTAPLSMLLGFSVFGLGDREGWPTEEEGFCNQAREVDRWMARLTGRRRAFPMGVGDVKSDGEQRLDEWRRGVQDVLLELAEGYGLGEGVPGSGAPVESDEEDVEQVEDQDNQSGRVKRRQRKDIGRVDDVEDLGSMVSSSTSPSAPVSTTSLSRLDSLEKTRVRPVLKEMVPTSSPTHATLTKQGYSIIGSHSGVKICRWTKSALRGRGSCYKYSFYGIASHLCMEATPSLSCSSKCVFCWRHSQNPVSTTWKWVTDPPELIFSGITAAHYQKIKMMKGVPGVRAERFAEAMRIRHCALSLVGEPIFYPRINDLLRLMHASRISTFLVCNAQHPAQLAGLIPVTQLYVSIDASNKESLRKIDRPLYRDFWERFCACLDILRQRRFEQRTVFRLTLVKGFNMAEEVKGYADLVERALPGFVEVKGVTYCGTTAAGKAGLTMQNVPFYEEVAAFVTALAEELSSRGLTYGIAAEHAHSCCVLLADSTRFQRDGHWATRIDFERFYDLYEGKLQGTRTDETGTVVGWRPEDYVGEETPEWALWGNGGFDPRDQRVWRKGKGKVKDDVQGRTNVQEEEVADTEQQVNVIEI